MRKLITCVFAAIVAALGINAQTIAPVTPGGATSAPECKTIKPGLNTAVSMQVVEASSATPPSRKAPTRKVAAAFPSGWNHCVATYKSAAAKTWGDGGSSVNVMQSGDSITIVNFCVENSVMKLQPTGTEGEYLIPNWQVVGNSATYGDVVMVPFHIVAVTDSTGKTTNYLRIDSTATGVKVTATSATSLHVDGMWGMVVKSGDNAGAGFYAGQDGDIVPSNATMTWKVLGDTTTYGCYIVARQEGDTLSITNFAGGGLTFKTAMNSRKKVTIGGYIASYQQARNKVLGFTIYGEDRYKIVDSVTAKTYIHNASLEAEASGDKTISWGPWTTLATYMNIIHINTGFYTQGRIDFDNALTWPVPKMVSGLKGDGTEKNPYLVENVADWKTVAAASQNGVEFYKQYVKLTSDLDFTSDSVPAIGSVATPFYGTFDGGGHTVTAKLVTSQSRQGLIGVLHGGTVKNLNAAGEFTFNSTIGGPIVGLATSQFTIDNCNNSATVNMGTNSQSVGGIVGYANLQGTISNCQNRGVINVNSTRVPNAVAGVCGYGDDVDFYNCSNTGKITVVNPDKAQYVSGINSYTSFSNYENCYNTSDITAGKDVAGISSYSGNGLCNAKNCYNTGNITSTASSGNYPTAGLFGYVTYGGTYENCYNTGNITASGATQYTGGIFGNYKGYSDNGYINVKNCYNTGNVTANGGNYVGGVAAFGYGINMDSCYNTGTITSNGSAYNKGSSVGGVIGQVQSFNADTTYYKNVIKNCYNLGDVKSSSYWVGGVIGNYATYNTVEHCWNAGNVTANSRSAGVVGYSWYASRIKECFNVGAVTLTADSPGTGLANNDCAAGIVGYSCTDVTDSYNAGAITGRSRIAGIFAVPVHGTSSKYKDHIYYTPSVRNSYNCGYITADADSCGNILGVHTSNNGTSWRPAGAMMNDSTPYQYNDTIENVMYLKGTCPNAITGEATNPEVGKNALELSQTIPSDKFTSPGQYCFPIIKGYEDNAYAKLYAAAVVPDASELTDTITTDFHVGVPNGAQWKSSYAGLTFTGNNATFGTDAYEGTVTLTVTVGGLSRDIVIKVKKEHTTGVDNVEAAKTVKSVRYYNLSGMQLAEPAGACIEVLEYTDGSHQAVKVMK